MKVKVWDLPTRIFHWLLALAVTGAFVTSLPPEGLTLHLYFGELSLCLGLFRLGWGFLGGYYARYGSFLKGPKAIVGYALALAKRHPPVMVEHNPLAAVVFGLMVVGSVAAGVTGLMVLAGQERIGLLAELFTPAQGAQAMEVHTWVVYSLLGAVVLHLAGNLVDSWLHKENAALSLLTGLKTAPEGYQAPDSAVLKPKCASRAYLGVMFFLTVGFLVLWPLDYHNEETREALTGKISEELAFYKEECGSCHFALPANLLPRRSWEKMMTQLEDHFGDDASLEPDEAEQILGYLVSHAAETSLSSASYRLTHSLAPEEAPQRITGLDYWKMRHEEIAEERFKQKPIGNKIHCNACHKYAEYGSFENAHIKVPEPEP
ncbi:MAG: hypothetical protein A2600_05635 [Candidatus Lambdaproteobacteria bacterium RIFOXYD1_FULL_56_27]|uniref:Cytochrome b561 bacterial/Ni-hydrogenase domain-containing protein n=1 Tax=Candidatus Lambdaproteobacteria bacterium RIFOXYD2_FULL_56_26 TaxID=1817773 RepID=A0A1F6GRA4_9PROT|nr:MAG: hypothetical protein A2557_03340 [Candidatus Lambdaproteobacteria bacterium RIFOXYD2_FULL_56_26]OGH07850.1 MAG: hypothetical protein A2600_05635 [Candidatus Lambdaproteobacteria bacterium RIFOXYD1_FULL_56_27]